MKFRKRSYKKRTYKVGDILVFKTKGEMYKNLYILAEKGIDTKPEYMSNNLMVVDICKKVGKRK